MSDINYIIENLKANIEQDSKSLEKQERLDVDFAKQTVNFFVEHLNNISNITKENKTEITEFLFLNNPENKIEKAFNNEKNKQKILNENKTKISTLTSEMNKAKNQLKREKEQNKELETLIKNKTEEISALRKEIRTQERAPSNVLFYKDLCFSLFLGGKGVSPLNGRIKNEDLNDKFLFLLKNRPELIPEKSELLKFDKQKVNDTDGYTVEILSKNNIAENLAFGVTTPCCLKLVASGTKYLYLSLFDPNTSMVVVKDKTGKAIATSLITSNDEEIGIWHIDSPQNSKIKREDVKKSINFLCNELKNKKPVFIAPGEATLTNLNLLNQKDVENINNYILKDLTNKEYYKLKQNIENTEKTNQELENDYEYNEDLLNCRNEYERSDLFYDNILDAEIEINKNIKETQNKVKEKIDQAVGSGRTDVGNFQNLAYALENIEELTEEGKNTLNNFIATKTNWKHKKTYTSMSNKFEVNENKGHGLCQTQFYL